MIFDNDLYRLIFVSRVAGVTIQNVRYGQIVNVGTLTNFNDALIAIGTEWEAASNDVLSTQVEYVAYTAENLTRNEAMSVVSSGNFGIAATESHPPDQTLRFNEYADAPAIPAQLRGSFNLSGTGEEFSASGRVNDLTEFDNIVTFLVVQFVDAPSGFTFNWMHRRQAAPGPPPVFTYHRITTVRLNPTYFKLKSRKADIF